MLAIELSLCDTADSTDVLHMHDEYAIISRLKCFSTHLVVADLT